ncbi:MAG: peptidase M23 [Bacteroidetes bacterium GWE2_41_25]|nr:MAG: peptidase M23 [Bacteroidetes bacterium GWA2_40_15]OFX89741.1 MAG: peptidase M23 [Bacteroidetes bacterium GWC2_40_22]OFY00631.1 MAG: peptidase M23 [Bacteroidetes bacterium GWE2_41_25]HBH84107.1 peptidase M23 [Bacteroidales bacterium]HBQ82447.1 peptidase M23 [Bacteroidales bacterium]
MLRPKYKFNPESLSFDKVRLGIKDILLRFLAYFIGSVIIAFVYWVIFAAFFDSPREKALEREIQQLTIQYDLINREMTDVEKVLEDLQKTDDNLYRTIFEAEPIPATFREGGTGGINRYVNLEGYSNSDLVIETASRLDKIRKRVYLQSKSFDELINLSHRKEEMLKSVPAILPISNDDLTRTASGYGLRIHPIYKITKFHSGMDFTAPADTEVYATGDGVISAVQSSQRGLGKNIIIDHGFGYSSIYAHLSNFNVRKGQKVKRGDVIGYVGNTGTSVANHLHYEIKLNGRNVDPVNYYFEDLTPAEYERMIEIASKTGQSFD